MKTKILFFFLVTGLFLVTSCSKYPPTSDRLLEDMVVYTKYDTSIDFNQFRTFSIVDSIGYISQKDSGKFLDSDAQAVLNQISQNMVARGYVLVNKTQDPDLGINVVMVKNVNVQVYYPGWYWGYPGYYPPWYWGGGIYYYPYYPAYITSYSTGTLLIDMVDLVNETPDGKMYIRWNAYIRGLLTNNHSMAQIKESIDQAFVQTKAFSK